MQNQNNKCPNSQQNLQRKSIPKYFKNELKNCQYYKKMKCLQQQVFSNYHNKQEKLFRDSIGDAMLKRDAFEYPMYGRVMLLSFLMLFPLKCLPKLPATYFSFKFLAYWIAPEVMNPFYSSDYFLYNINEANLKHFWRIVQ